MYKFNIKGRICLWVCLMWGVLSFVVLYFIHPAVAGQLDRISPFPAMCWTGSFWGSLIADTAATIYQLVRTSRLLDKPSRQGTSCGFRLTWGGRSSPTGWWRPESGWMI